MNEGESWSQKAIASKLQGKEQARFKELCVKQSKSEQEKSEWKSLQEKAYPKTELSASLTDEL